MYYVLCTVYYVLCIMCYILHIMYYVFCIMYYVLCIIHNTVLYILEWKWFWKWKWSAAKIFPFQRKYFNFQNFEVFVVISICHEFCADREIVASSLDFVHFRGKSTRNLPGSDATEFLISISTQHNSISNVGNGNGFAT